MRTLWTFLFILFFGQVLAQNSDSLYQVAREYAHQKNYVAAREVCERILLKHPNYHDVRILIGRTYAWSKNYDKGLEEFDKVLAIKGSHKDAIKAKAHALLWSDRYNELVEWCNVSLKLFNNDEELLYLRALGLEKLEKYSESAQSYLALLQINPAHEKSKQAMKRIKMARISNKVTLEYHYDQFFGRIDDWHMVTAAYTKKLANISVIGRFNSARRFGKIAHQAEVDAYPKLRKGTYAYLNYGYSFNDMIFPKHRFGFEPYQKLKWAMELSLGLRYLSFESKNVTIFTGSLGKYYKNWWFSVRPFYIVKADHLSQSYHFITRKYFKSAENYFGLEFGTGLLPDWAGFDGQGFASQNLVISKSLRANYQNVYQHHWLYNVRVGYIQEEGATGARHRFNTTLALSYLF